MPAWITDDVLEAYLLDILQKIGFEAVGSWDEIIPHANISAYHDIVSALLARGYTIDQIDAWDSRVDFNMDIGAYKCLVDGGCTKDFDETFILLKNRMLELLTLELIVDGEVVYPDVAIVGTIQSGPMSSDLDHFTLGSPDRGSCYYTRR